MPEHDGGDTQLTRPLIQATAIRTAIDPRIVPRKRALRMLSDTGPGATIVIQAPAGFGKSTLLTQWILHDEDRLFARLALEPADNDPTTFLTYLLAAIRDRSPGACARAWTLMKSTSTDVDEVLTETLDGLTELERSFVVILDDFHVITNVRCIALTQRLLDRMPSSMSLAITTRTPTPLSVDATGQLLRIDAGDLKFSLDETTEAFERTAHSIGGTDLDTLHRVTAGWPVAVYLAAARAQRQPHRFQTHSLSSIRQFVAEEIVAELSTEDRSILRDWSVVMHLTPDLCDALTQRSDSAARLRRLADDSLLVTPVDEQQQMYRVHDLLRDALAGEFASLPSEHQSGVHTRAADWWLEHQDVTAAIDHLFLAGDEHRAGELFCISWFDLMLGGRFETVARWAAKISLSTAKSYPPLLIALAWIKGFSGDDDGARRYAKLARESTFDADMPDWSSSYDSAVAIMRAGLGHDGMIDANAQAETAMLLEPPGSPWRATAASLAGVTRFGLGRFDAAAEALTESALSLDPTPGVAAYSRGQLALMEIIRGNWGEAAHHAAVARDLIDGGELHKMVSSAAAFVAEAMLAAHSGDVEAARDWLGSLAGLQDDLSHAFPFDALQIHLFAAETYLQIGDPNAARSHVASAQQALEVFGDAGIFHERLDTVVSRLDARGKGAVEGLD